jgi:FkbM family methyltransferase
MIKKEGNTSSGKSSITSKFKIFKSEVSPRTYLSLAAIEDVAFHFSESGEDIILLRLFNNKTGGFYVDVGAFRPRKYSNTYLLYRFFGWNGINIDASSKAIALFDVERPNDINLHVAVGPSTSESVFWTLNEPATNTLSEANLQRQLNKGKRIISQETVNVQPLSKILNDYVPDGRDIDLLNIDVEGLDFEVLKSNDWTRYRPKVILIEDYSVNEVGIENSEIYCFMKEMGYRLCSHTYDTSIYGEEHFLTKERNTPSIGGGVSWKDISLNDNLLIKVPGVYDRAATLAKAHPEFMKLTNELVSINKELKRESAQHKENTEQQLNRRRNELKKIYGQNEGLINNLAKLERDYKEVEEKIQKTRHEQNCIMRRYTAIQQSRTWRYTKPVRSLMDCIKRFIRLESGRNYSQNSKHNVLSQNQEIIYSAASLEKKLWGGFSTYALEDLENLKNSSYGKKVERRKAAWSLMRWYYVNGEYEKALENVEFINLIDPKKRLNSKRAIAQFKSLVCLGRKEEAKNLMEKVIKKRGHEPDLCLAMANVQQNEEQRLKWINYVFKKAGYNSIQKKDNSRPLALNNLNSQVFGSNISDKHNVKVSVIIPAYNADDMIGTALDSLLTQTWSNLEILVVDDCSTDNTVNIVSSYSERDKRVILIKKDKNEGAYAARNTALQHVTGDYITVHDSDDWSHPQKIESQLRALLKDPEKVCVVSYWVRVLNDLTVVGPWFPKGTFFEMNSSSLLFRSSVFDDLGVWDNVRVAGDTEFLWRVQKFYGESSLLKFEPTLPLSFALTAETSLTRSKATHARTVKFGLRRIYREAAKWWHDNSNSPSDIFIDSNLETRPFPSPIANYHTQPDTRHYDLVVVSDFNIQGGAFVSTYNYIYAALKLGKKVGVFHWRRYDLDMGKPLNSKIFELANNHNVDILVPGENMSAELVLVGYPAILKHKIDDAPNIDCKNLVVIVNQMASRLFSGGDVQYDPLIARGNLKTVFGKEGRWLPISPLVGRLMTKDTRYPTPSTENWYPMIDTEDWCSIPLKWRGNIRKRPVVGRHGRDHYTKWPTDCKTIEQAYGVSKEWDVRILGGADVPVKILGRRPNNWEILEFDAIDVRSFLKELDFFIHYTHDDYIEEFGRAVMEAMAVGIPVILPPKFKETFGDAALYAEPDEVADVIKTYWNSEELYMERTRIGRGFVCNNCSISNFEGRVERLKLI